MIVYLAVTNAYVVGELMKDSDVLCSYMYLKRDRTLLARVRETRNFLLDSGVFSMINSKKQVSIERYVDEYADFVKENRIQRYVEIDVDQIYGVQYTRKLRDRLEQRVGWRSIPVWHSIRGKDSFLNDTRDYDYIALGYFLTEGVSASITEKYARAFIDAAHTNNCKIHGLGFTKTTILKDFPFDSVDSSSWAASSRYGGLFHFNGKNMVAYKRPQGMKMKNYKDCGRQSFREWKKFQDYALINIKPISL